MPVHKPHFWATLISTNSKNRTDFRFGFSIFVLDFFEKFFLFFNRQFECLEFVCAARYCNFISFMHRDIHDVSVDYTQIEMLVFFSHYVVHYFQFKKFFFFFFRTFHLEFWWCCEYTIFCNRFYQTNLGWILFARNPTHDCRRLSVN